MALCRLGLSFFRCWRGIHPAVVPMAGEAEVSCLQALPSFPCFPCEKDSFVRQEECRKIPQLARAFRWLIEKATMADEYRLSLRVVKSKLRLLPFVTVCSDWRHAERFSEVALCIAAELRGFAMGVPRQRWG